MESQVSLRALLTPVRLFSIPLCCSPASFLCAALLHRSFVLHLRVLRLGPALSSAHLRVPLLFLFECVVSLTRFLSSSSFTFRPASSLTCLSPHQTCSCIVESHKCAAASVRGFEYHPGQNNYRCKSLINSTTISVSKKVTGTFFAELINSKNNKSA